jgi:hypothetical protein
MPTYDVSTGLRALQGGNVVADVDAGFLALAQDVNARLPTVVSALPGAPYDGQEIYYVVSAGAFATVVWHLRYRAASASAYKWEYVGGPPLYDFQSATSNLTVVGSVDTDMPNVATVTAPLAGDWDLDWEISVRPNTASGLNMSVGFTPVGASPGGLAWGLPHVDAQASAGQANLSASRRNFGVAAGTVYVGRYAQVFTSQVVYRSVKLTPVRVG